MAIQQLKALVAMLIVAMLMFIILLMDVVGVV